MRATRNVYVARQAGRGPRAQLQERRPGTRAEKRPSAQALRPVFTPRASARTGRTSQADPLRQRAPRALGRAKRLAQAEKDARSSPARVSADRPNEPSRFRFDSERPGRWAARSAWPKPKGEVRATRNVYVARQAGRGHRAQLQERRLGTRAEKRPSAQALRPVFTRARQRGPAERDKPTVPDIRLGGGEVRATRNVYVARQAGRGPRAQLQERRLGTRAEKRPSAQALRPVFTRARQRGPAERDKPIRFEASAPGVGPREAPGPSRKKSAEGGIRTPDLARMKRPL